MLSRKDYIAMPMDEFRKVLDKAKDVLADVEETFEFTCANTNAHLADSMIEAFDEELNENRSFVKMLEEIMVEKESKLQ